MICPKCGNKTKVIDTRFNVDENETYRRRLCTNHECSHRFYTTEFDVSDNDSFKDRWKNSIKGGR